MYATLLVCLILVIIWIYYNHSRAYSYPLELSGRWPIFGHLFKFCSTKLDIIYILQSLSKECTDKGGVIKMYLGPKLFYVITSPEDSIKISNLCLNKSKYYGFSEHFLGNGVVVAEASTWKKKRKIINLAFNHNILDEFMFIFNDKSRKLVQLFSDKVDQAPFDHHEILKVILLESICLTAFGVNIDKYNELYTKYLSSLEEILDIFFERFCKVWIHSDIVYNWTQLKKEEDEKLKHIESFNNVILQERKRFLMEERNSKLDSKSNFKPFMDIIIENYSESETFTDDDIKYEINNVVAAGFDTSATMITFVLTLLGSYRDVQDKVRHEINEVMGKEDRDVKTEDLPKLIYLEAVLKETLRLYPLGAVISRAVDRDVHMRNYTMKAGSDCLLLLWGLHRHPIWGPDADAFRPERWLEKGDLPNIHLSYAAFSLGRRSCAGKVYAMMNVKTILVYLLRIFNIESDVSKMMLKMDVIMRPHSGYEIKIKKI